MAFNQYGYNPFQSSYGAYAPQRFAAPQFGHMMAGTGYGAMPYATPGSRSPQSFNRPTYPSYGRPGVYPQGNSMPSQAPQVIYMMPAPQPKQKFWDWKKFAFNSVSIAAGLGIAGIFSAIILPKAITSEFMSQFPKRAREALKLKKDASLTDWAKNKLKEQFIDLTNDPEVRASMAKFSRETLKETLDESTVNHLRGQLSSLLSPEFIAQKIGEARQPLQQLAKSLLADEALKKQLSQALTDVINKPELTDAIQGKLHDVLSPEFIAQKMKDLHKPLKTSIQELAQDPELRLTLSDELTGFLQHTMNKTLDKATLKQLQKKIDQVLTPEFIARKIQAAQAPLRDMAMSLLEDEGLKEKVSTEASKILQKTIAETLTPEYVSAAVKRLAENGELTENIHETLAKILQGTLDKTLNEETQSKLQNALKGILSEDYLRQLGERATGPMRETVLRLSQDEALKKQVFESMAGSLNKTLLEKVVHNQELTDQLILELRAACKRNGSWLGKFV